MSSRRNLSHPSRRYNPNSRLFNRLQPLGSAFPTPVLCFQQLAASFPKTPGVGVSLQELAPCTEGQKCPPVSPLFATLTHSVSRKSFPCHSYANTRDRGVTPPPKFFSPLATRQSPLPLTTFRINTCKSVSKQTTLSSFRINTYEKTGEGGPPSRPLLTAHCPLSQPCGWCAWRWVGWSSVIWPRESLGN